MLQRLKPVLASHSRQALFAVGSAVLLSCQFLPGLASARPIDQTVAPVKALYALACTHGSIKIDKNNNLSCSNSNGDVTVQGIGSISTGKALEGQPYSNALPVTTFTVDCGGNHVNVPQLGAKISKFSCDKGKAKVTKGKSFPAVADTDPKFIPLYGVNNEGITTGAGTNDCDNHTNGTCAPCSAATSAADRPDNCVTCSNNSCADPAVNCTKDNCDLIKKYVNPAIGVFTVAFGLIAAGSLILAGLNYVASEGDPQKTAKAKDRIAKTIFAIITYMFLYAFLQFIIPGGAFNR